MWALAFGYFAAYVPYAALTKALSSSEPPISGVALLPGSTLVSAIVMMGTLWAMGWLRHARHVRVGSLEVPAPRPLTLFSGIATAAIVVSTTLAYTFDGVSVALAMIAMRALVLVIAPIVDLATGRAVSARSWTALGLSLLALVVAAWGQPVGTSVSPPALLDLAAYGGA